MTKNGFIRNKIIATSRPYLTQNADEKNTRHLYKKLRVREVVRGR